MIRLENQRGSAFILALVAINSILILGAVLFFLGRYQVAKTQADGFARNIALSALKNYNESADTTCKKYKTDYLNCIENPLNAGCQSLTSIYKLCRLGYINSYASDRELNALTEAKTIAELSRLLADPNIPENAASVNMPFKRLAQNQLKGAELKPGRWVERATNPNECQDNGNSKFCFIDYGKDFSTFLGFLNDSQKNVNAFRVEGKLFPKGVKGFFGASLLGNPEFPVKVNATSAIVPRTGCFLVDISHSTTFQSHRRKDKIYRESNIPECKNYLQYSSSPSKSFCCPSVFAADNEYNSYYAYPLNYATDEYRDGTKTYFQTMTAVSAQSYENHDASWACLEKDRNVGKYSAGTGPALEDYWKQIHYVSNYKSHQTLVDNDYLTYGENHPSFLDYPLSDKTINYPLPEKTKDTYYVDEMSEPQPLKSIFDALKGALDEFEKKSVPGDKACVIFYDNKNVWPRIFTPTSDWSSLKNFTDFRPDELESDPIARKNFDTIIKHGLFPGFLGSRVDGKFKPTSFTNTHEALRVALELMDIDKNISKIPTSNFVVLISDGMTNCCVGCGVVFDRILGQCSNDFAHYTLSVGKLKEFVNVSMVNKGIPLHVVLLGDYVQPNNNCFKKNSNGDCLTDKEFRADNQFRVDNNLSPYNFIDGGYYAGKMYGQLQTSEREEIETQFLNASEAAPFLLPNYDFYTMAVQTQGLFVPIRKKRVGCVDHSPESYSDREKITTDPLCREPGEQLEDALREIVRYNPLAIVDIK